MKRSSPIPIIITIALIAIGLLNLILWHQQIVSVYGLVFGSMSMLLAWFVFHFRN